MGEEEQEGEEEGDTEELRLTTKKKKKKKGHFLQKESVELAGNDGTERGQHSDASSPPR